MKNTRKLLLMVLIAFPSIILCQENNVKNTITVPSYLLRDRAIVLDSLVLKKQMYVSFKSSLPLKKIKGGAAYGTLSHPDGIIVYDTAYLFDEAAGNFGFSLPYEIPEGKYHVKIEITNSEGKLMDSYSNEYERNELKPYFNRSIQFWDFTTPYAHLDCRGYGTIAYQFNSNKSISDLQRLGISGRMTTGNGSPGLIEVQLNGISLKEFNLPGGDAPNAIVDWRLENDEMSSELAIRKGENQLTFILKPDKTAGEGLRIFSSKNSTDPEIKEAVQITLKVEGGMPAKQTVFSIPVWGEEGEHISSKLSIPGPEIFTLEQRKIVQESFPLKSNDIEKGYVIFSKDFQRYVYPWSIPKEKDLTNSLDVRMGQNDFEPVTFSIYPIRDLGDVRVSVSELGGPDGIKISSETVQIHVVKTLKKRSGSDGEYKLIPRLLDRTNHVNIPISYTTRFWLTVYTDSTTLPGKYSGLVRIDSENEKSSTIPFTVEVLPIRLTPVPDIEYSMCMSYEFYELESKDWTAQEKEKIYLDGVNVFRDYKNHGMSTVDVTTPYYFQWNKDGTPRMEHFKAMIRGAKEVGFSNPIYWYFGHYVQAAKGQHPGNVRTYNPKVHPKRAKFLVETAIELNRELDGPPIYFMPIDEPRIASRKEITLDLFKEMKKVPGVKIMCTTDIGGEMLDIENNSQVDRKTLGPGEKERISDRKVWEYNNTAIQSNNPAYSRYIYGYYTWRQDLDGMNSWGPGTTENSRGNPFEDLDSKYSDYFIFFPHVNGPLPTLNWEAVREGIDDIRYIYQLERLCVQKASEKPEEVAMAEQFLNKVRSMCDFDERTIINDFGDWTPERFDSIRNQVISLIIELNN